MLRSFIACLGLVALLAACTQDPAVKNVTGGATETVTIAVNGMT